MEIPTLQFCQAELWDGRGGRGAGTHAEPLISVTGSSDALHGLQASSDRPSGPVKL